MSKYKAGLHKDVSTIFNGVSLPKSDVSAPAPEHQDNSALKQAVETSPAPASAASEPAVIKSPAAATPVSKPVVPEAPASKPNTPSHMTPTKPEPPSPSAQPPKEAQAKTPVSKPAVPEVPALKPNTPSHMTPTKPEPPSPSAQPPKEAQAKTPVSKPAVPETPAAKSAAPSHMTQTKPEPQSPSAQPPKETRAKQSKANAAVKNPLQRTLDQIRGKLFASKPGISPAKQKAVMIAIPVVFIVLIFIFVRAFSSPSQKVSGRPGRAKAVKAVTSATDTKVEWKVPEPYPTTLRDPMQFGPVTPQSGGGETTVDIAGLVVKGIVYSKSNPCAVVGDRLVHKGDQLMGVVIVEITENSVEFGVNGKRWTQKVQR